MSSLYIQHTNRDSEGCKHKFISEINRRFLSNQSAHSYTVVSKSRLKASVLYRCDKYVKTNVDVFHNSDRMKYSFVSTTINLSNLAAVGKIQKSETSGSWSTLKQRNGKYAVSYETALLFVLFNND